MNGVCVWRLNIIASRRELAKAQFHYMQPFYVRGGALSLSQPDSIARAAKRRKLSCLRNNASFPSVLGPAVLGPQHQAGKQAGLDPTPAFQPNNDRDWLPLRRAQYRPVEIPPTGLRPYSSRYT